MTLKHQVTEFMTAFDQPRRATPGVPDDATVRLRLRLIAEEMFELIAAALDSSDEAAGGAIRSVQSLTMTIIDHAPVGVDLPEFADACADLDYVVEGTRQAFGIDGRPIAAEVHRANMAKVGGPVDEHGKKRKPAGWQPPDIEGELRKQGWRP